MSRKKFYCVAHGNITGVFTEWSACEKQVYRVQNSVHQRFKNIDKAVAFLLAGGTYNSCTNIPVYDEHMNAKYPQQFGHVCTQNVCTSENVNLDDESESDDEFESDLNKTFLDICDAIAIDSNNNTPKKSEYSYPYNKENSTNIHVEISESENENVSETVPKIIESDNQIQTDVGEVLTPLKKN